MKIAHDWFKWKEIRRDIVNYNNLIKFLNT